MNQLTKKILLLQLVFLAITICSFVPASAETTHIDTIEANRFIEAYRKYFEENISANLFASKAEDARSLKTRQSILNFIAENKLNAKQETIDKEWQTFLDTNYKDPQILDKTLKDRYLSMDYVKNKFIENQDLTVYFNQFIMPKIKNDIELRKRIFKVAKAQSINFSKEDMDRELNQMISNWGGDEAFGHFMTSNHFEKTDIVFLLQTNLMRDRLNTRLLSQEIENDPSSAKDFKNSIDNHFYNFSLKNKANYYFKQAFIPISDEDAMAKIIKARSNFNSTEELKKIQGLEVYDMSYQLSEESYIYHPKIKDAILKLGKDPLLVSKEISPVIQTEKGYHLVQIQSIDLPEKITYSEAYDDVYRKLINTKIDDFPRMIDTYFSAVQQP